ncbi:unnamed protein product, partial [Choristocarpus tenellus]
LGRKPKLTPGLFCQQSPRNKAIIERVPALNPPHYKGTPWMFDGDMATMYPFVAFRHEDVNYTRRWLAVNAGYPGCFHANIHESANGGQAEQTGAGGQDLDQKDGMEAKEAVALDYSLPNGGLDVSRPFYLVLHGLNGGSKE